MSLMKQFWNITCTDPDLKPQLAVKEEVTLKSTKTTVDINGFLNNKKLSADPTSPNMVASSSWLTYPISMYDTTKFNFTLKWENYQCSNNSWSNPIACTPQGGFAIVFQQESATALGEYRNNLGEGLGYDGLSGVLAIEFDMLASVHNQQPINNNLQISLQVRNQMTTLLSTSPSNSFATNKRPSNFGNFDRNDFTPDIQVELGFIPNQFTQEVIIILLLNGIPQIQETMTFKDLGLDPNRVYYMGFSGAQNLNSAVTTGTLNILNFRLFKTKPKFVDGQVSYLYEQSDTPVNNSFLEVRSSFYDLCMQKTTSIVYPTVSINDWLNGNETEPRILAFLYNRDVFVIGSSIQPLKKAQFYRPHLLTITPDVKFQMSIPTGRTQAIRMGFYWGLDLIMNITAIDYFRQQQSSNFAFIVIENSDLITGSLSVKGYANNNYQFNVVCYNRNLKLAPVTFSTLQLTVTSDYIRLNDTVYSNIVPTTCYGVKPQGSSSGESNEQSDPNKNDHFTCTFLPNVNGTYYINSPFLPSGRSFKVEIGEADQVTRQISSEYSQAIVQGDFAMNVGSMIEVLIDLRDHKNNAVSPPPQDCTFTKSYYVQNEQKYSFLFYDSFPYLRTQISRAGVAEFRITISCTSIEFDLQCFRCQKMIVPINQFFSYKISIPAFPSQFDIQLDEITAVMLPQGSSLAVDITFYDRFDNIIQTELTDSQYNDIKMQFIYYNRTQKRVFNLTKASIPGKVMLSLNDADNAFFRSLPARANTYFLEIQVPSLPQCSAVERITKGIYLVNQDKLAPIEMIGEQDQIKHEPLLASIQWDSEITSGRIARFAFTLRNPNMMQMNSWPSPIITDYIDAKLVDPAKNSLITSSQCSVKFGFGLYEGEYFGWLLCKQAPRFAFLSILYGTGTSQVTLQNSPLNIWIKNSNASQVDKQFYQQTTTSLTLGSGGLNIVFRIQDDYGNQVDNQLIDPKQPQLGQITYNLTRLETGLVSKFDTLPLFNISGYFKIHIDNLPIGTYRLQLNLPTPITTDLKFISSSTELSPLYSFAQRDNANTQTVLVNSQVTVKVFARNIHNQTIDRNADSVIIGQQMMIYLTNSLGYTYHMKFEGTFTDTTIGQIYYNFTTIEPIRRNGLYFCKVYFPAKKDYLFVQNGIFSVNDRFDPFSSELYFIKGIEQKEFRMVQYDPQGGLDNSFNASHYDPRIDGSMRFKMYLRSNIINEIITQADFTNVQFKGAYLASAMYVSTGQFQMQTNYSNIQFTISNINNDHLLITPATWADQDLIDKLQEGYYFLFVTGTQLNINNFQLQWMFSYFNSDNDPSPTQNQMNFYAPRFINITAGEPFTFVVAAYGNKAPRQINVIVSKQELNSIEIDRTSDNVPAGFIYYVTVYHETAGIYYPEIKADTLPARQLMVQVNPAPFHRVNVIDPSLITTRRVPIGTSITYNFTLVDRYGNNIQQFARKLPPIERINDMVQVVHMDRKPVDKFVRAVTPLMYQANFTTQYVGSVSLVVPLATAQSASTTFTQALANITFELSTAKQIPSALTSYAFLRQKTIQAGQNVQLELRLLDEYDNRLMAVTTPVVSTFSVNLIPDNSCNTSSIFMPFLSQSADVALFQVNLTKSCLYTVQVYYFSQTDGQQSVSCLNCYLRVFAAAEDYRRFDFLDVRDTLINAFSPTTQQIYLNKYDWNPKLMFIMRDLYGNLITTRTKNELAFNYTFELLQRGTQTVLRTGNWEQLRSFHMISFCNEETLNQFCMLPTWNLMQLRIRQINKSTQKEVGRALINVQLVDNLGTFYNSDSLNPISANYTYIRILNADAVEKIAQDIAIIPDRCIGGEQFPLIGRIELRTFQGFRVNDTFANLQNRLSLNLTGIPPNKYQLKFFPGNTQGEILFTLFLRDDYFLNAQSAIAYLSIDGQEQTFKKIVIQCNKRMNYNKHVTTNGTDYLTSFADYITQVQAGEQLRVIMTGMLDSFVIQPEDAQFIPYDQEVYLNYTAGSWIKPSYTMQAIDIPDKLITVLNFTGITKAGNVSLVGSGIPDTFLYNFTVLPGPLSAEYSQVSNEQLKVLAGTNATLLISLSDRFGNSIILSNSTNDIQTFNNQSVVQIASLSSSLLGHEQWKSLASGSCFDVVQGGRIRCQTKIKEKGLYKWRVIIRGEIAQCINCFMRVVPTGKVAISQTVMTDLSQNFYQSQNIAMGKFNVFPKTQYIYFKVFLKDEEENVYIHEEVPSFEAIFPKLSNATTDVNLAIQRIGNSRATNALIYKVTVVQSVASFNSFALTKEGLYSLKLVTTNSGSVIYPLYIRDNRTSPGYIVPKDSSLILKTKEKTYLQKAGHLIPVSFGLFFNDFLSIGNYQDLNLVSFSNPSPAQSGTLITGLQIVAQYRGLYEKYQKFTTITIVQPSYSEQYTVTININGLATSPSFSLFQTTVFPGSLSRIQYSTDFRSFQVKDEFNNDIDYLQEPLFNIQVIAQRALNSKQLPPSSLANDAKIKLNYTSRMGSLTPGFEVSQNLSSYAVVDSLQNTYPQAFMNYPSKYEVDFSQSTFSYSLYNFVAGGTLFIRAHLVDRFGQPLANFINNTNAQGNLTVNLIYLSANASEYGRRIVRQVNFKGAQQVNGVYQISIQVNQSTYYYIEVRYFGVRLENLYGRRASQWFYVDVEHESGQTRNDMQWGSSTIVIQQNQIYHPFTTDYQSVTSLDYVQFMKGQPLYFITQICDIYGNPFYSPSDYETFNTGDVPLLSRVRNYGDTRQINLNLQFVWNFMTTAAYENLNRLLVRQFVPSKYPLEKGDSYDNQKSFKIDIYLNNTNSSIGFNVFYLVITSDFAIDTYHSSKVTNNRELDVNNGGLYSADFDGGMQMKIRQNTKSLLVLQVRNSDNRPYLAEPITNFTLELRNFTQQNITVGGKNTTIFVPLSTVNMTVIPFSNNAFYRVLINSSVLYQDPSPLNTRVTIMTQIKYSINPQLAEIPLWVFPQTPPNYLNPIVNTTYLKPNEKKFQPATKITFLLQLMFNDQIYLNDRQSALRIKVFRRSAMELVTAQLINKTHYSVSVNLEGPQTNQFRILYQETNGALFPITNPEVLNFEISTGPTTLLTYDFESFYYEKLGLSPNLESSFQTDLSSALVLQQRTFDPTKLRLILLPNMVDQGSNSFTYFIGNEFRTSILIVDTQTSRCLLQSDYTPSKDVKVLIHRYDPVTKTQGRISIDVESISLVQRVIIQSTSYCTFYSIATLESSAQLNSEGNYSLTATFQNNLNVNFTFQAKILGIDFTKTTIGWYQRETNSNYQQERLIAEFNAYDEFNYVIYFRDVQGNYVSDRQQYVGIDIKFDQQKLSVEKDYIYISRYDDRFKGYLITIVFLKSGSYQPEYYFNLQRADNIEIKDGPLLFVVREPQCVSIQVLSISAVPTTSNNGQNQASLSLGQLFNFVFHCYDLNGREIKENINGLRAQAVFTNHDMNNQQLLVDVDSLQNGIYRVGHRFFLEGTYSMKIYFNELLIYEERSRTYQVSSDLCKDRTPGGSGQLLFRCPNNPGVCANSYLECKYINTTRCPNVLAPFLCGTGGSASDRCVSNMQSECCRINDRSLQDYKWCPHINSCVNVTQTSCPSMSPQNMYYCQSKNKFVDNQTQCCEDLKYNVTRILNDDITIVEKLMTKCSQEDKCVPENTAEFCFFSFQRNCAEIFGSEFPYQCPNDGRCRRNSGECPSPRVCPSGYTQCPDYTCIRGLDRFSQCNKLQNCTRTLPDGSIVDFIRCPDGSCSKTYEDCPSQVSCMIPGQVVCPDGSCKDSPLDCIQPNECNSDKPYKCPGFPSVCATSRQQCPLPSSKSCGSTLSLCANGDCSAQCKKSTEYFSSSSTALVAANTLPNKRDSCDAQGLVQCPNYECRASYLDCSDTLYCPIPINYTYSPQAMICPGAQICALKREDCSYSQCESGLNLQFLPSPNTYDRITVIQASLETCYDGRCHLQGRQKQQVCMTPVSCSNNYIKSGGFGEFCLSNIELAQSLIEISILSNDYKCPSNQMKCVTGECRSTLDDCPSQITCPSDFPIQCRDGQCVRSRAICEKVDQAIEQNLLRCQSQRMLLCTSDLMTCTYSLSNCSSRSTCPIGFIKCWDESCVNLESGQQCPSVTAISNSKRESLSTCSDRFSFPYHCFADGSCRANLQDCPSMSYCPPERPVKCAADHSCRKSIQNCPRQLSCSEGFKFCSGEGTCLPQSKPCGTPITCPAEQPFKCEDGTCASHLSQCYILSRSLSRQALTCLQDETNFLCMNDHSKCTLDIQQCPSSSPCIGSPHLVKSSEDKVCYQSRIQLGRQFMSESETQGLKCYLNNQFKCSHSGQCQEKPCDEWLICRDGQHKCWDGQCVSDQKLCRLKDSGCPVYLPFRCNYTGQCVSNISECEVIETIKPRITSLCQTRYGLPYACQQYGSCVSSLSECPTSSIQTCINQFPNSQKIVDEMKGECLVQVCPELLPHKCANGLCVSSSENCPLSTNSFEEIQYCSLVSQKKGLDLYVPCGNGQCVERSDQCQPLYDCKMNVNSGAFVRCSDGTCQTTQSKCPQFISNTSQSFCPSHIPFLCTNGQCAKTQGDCLRNHNGCPQSLPFKCPQTGQCTLTRDACQNPLQQMAQMFIYPNFIPAQSSTPLIAVYGRTRSTCQSRGQFTCRLGTNGNPYCVDRLDDCIAVDNNCPVNKPIRCGNQCLTSYLDCIGPLKDDCTSSSLRRCPSTTMTSGQCTVTVNDFSNCQTREGCPMESSSFRCQAPQNSRSNCQTLPFSTFISLSSNTCTTFDQQLSLPMSSAQMGSNECTNAQQPYSCADGSCVANIGQCPTCIYYCSQLKRCVRSQQECSTNSNEEGSVYLQQSCPLSAPVRCILSGECVRNEFQCNTDQQARIPFNQTFQGSLLSEKCPSLAPIRCQDGRCVTQYDQCVSLIRTRLNSSSITRTSNSLNNPLKWGSVPNFAAFKHQPCQVICQDGSCRDRVENCPLVQGCYDPSRPYRCRSGFCARDRNHCLQTFDSMERNDDEYHNSQSCNDALNDQVNKYKRCEDGVCRPLIPIFNSTTNELIGYNQTCLPFMGCPIDKPYHCPTGECAVGIESCAGTSQCPVDRPFRCKNYECVQNINQCDRPFSTYSALQLDLTFDPLDEASINFAYDSTGHAIGKLLIPSSAIALNNATGNILTQMQSLQRLQLYPVPDSILNSVQNQIPASRVSYLSRIYPLSENKFLSRGQTLLSPAVMLESPLVTDVSRQSGKLTLPSSTQRYLQETSIPLPKEEDSDFRLQRPLYLYFKRDLASFPHVLNEKEDICLGKVQQSTILLWQCEQRNYTLTDDGFYRFRISSLGIYALIVNPDPDVSGPNTMECGFLCKNQLTILVILMAAVILIVVVVYAMCQCCKTQQLTQSKLAAENKRVAMLMASQNDSFFVNGDFSRAANRSSMPAYISKEAFFAGDGPRAAATTAGPSLDHDIMDRVKEVLDTVDTSDPPLMPGQVVVALATQNDTQNKQIEELKCQLQEQNEREKENLKLIQRIFHQKQLIYEQMQVQSDLRSQSKKAQRQSRKRRKEAINDPSMMKEYEEIEQYLAKILSETHLPEVQDPKASTATFQQFPGVNTLRIPAANPADESLQSIPLDHIAPLHGGGGIISNPQPNNPLNTESMKHLLTAGQRTHQSTTNLELNRENRLKRKAADMLLKNVHDNDDIEEYKYEERAEQAQKFKTNKATTGHQEDNDEVDERNPHLLQQHREGMGYQPTNDLDERRDPDMDDISGIGGIDQETLSKTLNQLFSKALMKGGGRGGKATPNMLMGAGAGEVSGSVSGNLVRSKMERAMAARVAQQQAAQQARHDEDDASHSLLGALGKVHGMTAGSAQSTQAKVRRTGNERSGAFDDNSDESDENLIPYEEDQKNVNIGKTGSAEKAGSKQTSNKKGNRR